MMIYRGILIRSLFIAVFVLSPSLYAARRTTDFTQKPDSWFNSDEGRKALNNILSWQSEHGDWPKNKDCSSKDPSGSPIWARFYEIETNRPFFCDRDGIKKYRLEEISSGRQNAYAWYNYAGDKVAKAYDIWPHR